MKLHLSNRNYDYLSQFTNSHSAKIDNENLAQALLEGRPPQYPVTHGTECNQGIGAGSNSIFYIYCLDPNSPIPIEID